MRRALCNAAGVATIALLVGCGGLREDPILQYSSAEALEEGKRLLAESKYRQARPFLSHAFEIEPNSASGREGLLLAADSMFLDGGQENFVKAESRYRDFVNRFPTSEHAAYAQFQIGLSLSRRVAKADRDQSVTVKALEALSDVERFYPGSTYAKQAAEQITQLNGRQAEHDYLVGRFYGRFRVPLASMRRFENILETYPDYEGTDKVLLALCQLHFTAKDELNLAKASTYCRRLKNEFPESPLVRKIPKSLPLDLEVPVEDEAPDDSARQPADTGL